MGSGRRAEWQAKQIKEELNMKYGKY